MYKIEYSEQDGNFFIARLWFKYKGWMDKNVVLHSVEAKTAAEAIGKLVLEAYDNGNVLPFELVENSECMNV